MAELGNKGLLGLIFTAAIFIAAVGIVLSVGGDVVYDVGRGNVLSETVTNQSVTFTNNTAHGISGGRVSSITTLANQTVTYTANNYSLTATDYGSSLYINISCGSPGGAGSGNCTGIGSTLNVSYSVLSQTRASLAAGNATQGVSNFQLPNVGTVTGAVIIIVVIMSIIGGAAFTMTRRSRGE